MLCLSKRFFLAAYRLVGFMSCRSVVCPACGFPIYGAATFKACRFMLGPAYGDFSS
jgi:hypothetical protein